MSHRVSTHPTMTLSRGEPAGKKSWSTLSRIGKKCRPSAAFKANFGLFCAPNFLTVRFRCSLSKPPSRAAMSAMFMIWAHTARDASAAPWRRPPKTLNMNQQMLPLRYCVMPKSTMCMKSGRSHSMRRPGIDHTLLQKLSRGAQLRPEGQHVDRRRPPFRSQTSYEPATNLALHSQQHERRAVIARHEADDLLQPSPVACLGDACPADAQALSRPCRATNLARKARPCGRAVGNAPKREP